MMIRKCGFIVSALVFLAGLNNPASGQSQRFSGVEVSVGHTENQWAFLTAWNLSTESLQISPSWFTGENRWDFSQTHYQQWIAKFIYDQNAGATRELQWSYTQTHVQAPASEHALVGTWRDQWGESTIIYRADGTYQGWEFGDPYTGTWEPTSPTTATRSWGSSSTMYITLINNNTYVVDNAPSLGQYYRIE